MKKSTLSALLTATLSVFSPSTFADFGIPINFTGSLSNSCDFVSDESVLSTIDSLTLTLNEIVDSREECQGIYANSKVYLNTISSQLTTKAQQEQITDANIKEVQKQIYDLIAAESYAGEFDADLMALKKEQALLTNTKVNEQESMISTLKLGQTLLEDLSSQPQCDDRIGDLLLRPSLMMLGQVAASAYPGSNQATTSLVGSFKGLLDSFIGYAQSRFDTVETTLTDLINSKNYYNSYKCAYKNINKTTCNLRQRNLSKTEIQNLKEKALAQDTPQGDFRTISLLKKHYPRIQNILANIKDIYETARQKETIVEIASIQKEISDVQLFRPSPFRKREWTDADERMSPWKDWSRYLYWSTQYIKEYYTTFCKQVSDELPRVYNVSNNECEPNTLLTTQERNKFLQLVIAPALNEVNNDLSRLSLKLRESVNVERLFYAVRAEEDYAQRNKQLKISQVLDLFEKDLKLPETRRPLATKLFAKRIENTTRALKALIEYDKDFNDLNYSPMQVNPACDIQADTIECDTFADLSQAVYLYLAKNLTGGAVLSVDIIDASFYNYLDGVQDYFLNGLDDPDQDTALRYSKYSFYSELYNSLRQSVNDSNSSGSSDLPLMNKAKHGFEKVFGYEITKRLYKDVKKALSQGSSSDYYREAIHSCAIYYPMLRNRKNSTKNSFKRSKMRKTQDLCTELLESNGGIDILVSSQEKFPLQANGIDYTRQCYYKEYENEVVIKKVVLQRELEDDLPEL